MVICCKAGGLLSVPCSHYHAHAATKIAPIASQPFATHFIVTPGFRHWEHCGGVRWVRVGFIVALVAILAVTVLSQLSSQVVVVVGR